MVSPQDDAGGPGPAPGDDEGLYRVGRPVDPPPTSEFLARHLRGAELKLASAADEPPPPPRWPMLSGVLTFPWRLKTLGAWLFITLGLMATGWLLMFWWGPGARLGLMGARLFGLPTCAAAVLTMGYAASCCLIVIEETANGWDSIEVAPEMNWKEWVWDFGHFAVLLLQAGAVGMLARLASFSDAWLPMAAGTFAAFPFVLLGALAADGAWFPLAIGSVLRSVPRLWRAWGLFYAVTGALAVGWTLLTTAGLAGAPWPVPLYAAPLLAAVILIYARLAGRLAACIAAKSLETEQEGDPDEDA